MCGVSELDVPGKIRVSLPQQAGEQNLSLGVRLLELGSLHSGQSVTHKNTVKHKSNDKD